jgi:hypothetical protein
VFCTHGEVVRDLQEALGQDAPDLFGPGRLREKGSVWILDRQGGSFVGARYIDAAKLKTCQVPVPA